MSSIIDLHLGGDGAWSDLAGKPPGSVLEPADGAPIKIVTLDGGMQSGLPSVAIRIDLPDGRAVVAETSVRLFLQAAAAMRGRYGDL